jgi:hypothetical protein
MAPQLEAIREQQHGGMGAAKAAAYIMGRHEIQALHV